MANAVIAVADTLGHTISTLQEADVAIDFSHRDAVEKNVTYALMHKVPLVIGTTGWDDLSDTLFDRVKKAKGTLLYGANFAPGVYLFQSICRYAEAVTSSFPYEITIHEVHHREKQDTPSGTALLLQGLLKENNIPIKSERTGDAIGSHSVTFTSEEDTLTLTHTAHSREVFARGALFAAEWVENRVGVYTFSDAMEERLQWNFRKQSLRS